MTKQTKRNERPLSLSQVSKETGVPQTTLRAWERELELFNGADKPNQYGPNDVTAARAVKRFLDLDGATLDDARRLIDAAGHSALIAALGRAPERKSADSPARSLQDTIYKAAAAGLFGEVMADVTGDEAAPASETPVASLGRARLERLLVANDTSDRKQG